MNLRIMVPQTSQEIVHRILRTYRLIVHSMTFHEDGEVCVLVIDLNEGTRFEAWGTGARRAIERAANAALRARDRAELKKRAQAL